MNVGEVTPDHAATVRAFLDNCVPGLTTPDVADAQTALDALVAALSQAEGAGNYAIRRLNDVRDDLQRRAERAERQRDRAIEALEARWRELLDQADASDDDGSHVGFSRHYRAKAEGVAEAIKIAREALAAIEKDTA